MKSLLAVVVGLYLVAMLVMAVAQRRFLYFPDAARVAPAAVGLPNVEEVTLATPDGETLIAWHGCAAAGQSTLLYFHGNGGNLAGRRGLFANHMSRGRGVFMLSYRGYSGSTGSPSEANNMADARRAYDALIARGVAATDIVIAGESLGTGVATQLAAAVPSAGLMLESPYTSVADRAAEIYPWLPVRLLLRDRYDSRAAISAVRVPLLIVHGARDDVIPVAMGQALHAAANEPKDLVVLPMAGHHDLDLNGAFEAEDAWLRKLRAAAK